MQSQTLDQAMIWLDQRKAMVFTFTAHQLSTQKEIYSNVDAHNGHDSSTYHTKGHQREVLNHFYEDVLQHLGIVDNILILGPGQAKYGLRQHIKSHHHKALKNTDITLENAPYLTTSELLDRAETFFKFDQKK
ncbi:MAG: hypothetical protein KDJ52_09410 [Anaerolineae bacterium]|nr:hypothetical protein [Anaerolineae bacterium]